MRIFDHDPKLRASLLHMLQLNLHDIVKVEVCERYRETGTGVIVLDSILRATFHDAVLQRTGPTEDDPADSYGLFCTTCTDIEAEFKGVAIEEQLLVYFQHGGIRFATEKSHEASEGNAAATDGQPAQNSPPDSPQVPAEQSAGNTEVVVTREMYHELVEVIDSRCPLKASNHAQGIASFRTHGFDITFTLRRPKRLRSASSPSKETKPTEGLECTSHAYHTARTFDTTLVAC